MNLADGQRALVDALVADGEVPPGFDAAGVRATRTALRRKRAGEVARTWPFLAASFGERWPAAFATWAADHPPQGSLRDGWDFARTAGATPTPLAPLARAELADREAAFTYDGINPPTPRGRVTSWLRRHPRVFRRASK